MMAPWTGPALRTTPHGYLKLRRFLAEAATRLAEAGFDDDASRVRIASEWVGLPSEWMGESALALKVAIGRDGLPSNLAADMNDALSAIRLGFQRVGDRPTF